MTGRKPPILFDIDNTLIDTKKLLDQFVKPQLAKLYGLPLEKFLPISDKYWQTLTRPTFFNPSDYITFLIGQLGKTRVELEQIVYQAKNYEQSLFSEVIDTLIQLKKERSLGIFSEGLAEFQLRKLQLSGLVKYFDQDLMFITDNKITATFLASLPQPTVVIEDRLEIVKKLMTEPELRVVWLNRHQQKAELGIPTCQTLSEILHLI